MKRPRLLDLFCGAGGCSVGYQRAGFDVEGIDLEPHPDYPYPFRQADALEVLADVDLLLSYDVVHASPPCKSETDLAVLSDRAHPNLLGPTLGLLRAVPGLVWVVENVEGTRQMPDALLVCGASFGPLAAPAAAPPVRVVGAAHGAWVRLPEGAADRRLRHRGRRADDPRIQGPPGGVPGGDGHRLDEPRRPLAGHPARLHADDRRAAARPPAGRRVTALQLDLLAMVAEETAGRCWRCRHNLTRPQDGRQCWCDLPIPYPPGEPLHDGETPWLCWCADVPQRDIDGSEAWADAWVLAREGAA